MRIFLLVLLVAAAPALGQNVTIQRLTQITLLRGTSTVATHTSWAACEADMDRRARLETQTSGTRTFTCQTERRVVVATYSPAPGGGPLPVNCAVSAFTLTTPGPWTPGTCPASGQQTRTETWSRTVTTQPANGGTACPVLTEPRTGTQACSFVPPPVGGSGPTISLNPTSYAVGDYSTISWRGTNPCNASAAPAYAAWSGAKAADWSQSVAPNVTTVFTITCANGSGSTTLTVSGSAPPPPPPPGGGPPPPPPGGTLPVPTVLPTPIALTVRPFNGADSSIAPALKYAETARRNWNFEGHVVAVPFDEGQGYWDYTNCTVFYSTWLFDRPSAWFKLFELTGDPSYRDLAVSDFRYWVGKIDARGFFSCKLGEDDTKYLYITPFLAYEKVTGDTQYRPVADRIYAQSAQGFSNTYSTGTALWTEREVGIHLDAALGYYELTGDQQALARAAALVRQWTTVAGTSGAPQVSYTQHEGGGPGGTQPTNLTNSPWMSAFYFQAARRYWQVTGDQVVLQQASKYFDWLTVNGLYDGSLFHSEFAGVTVPRYLTGALIGDAGYDEGNLLHCPDVQGMVSFAVLAKQRLGQSTTVANQRLNELKGCSVRMWANWARETNYLPKYRIQASRSWNWWARGLYEYSLQ